jgi:hypothetical protein
MVPRLPKPVTERLASRGHRMHHFLWHEVRNRWNLPPGDQPNQGGLTDEAKKALRDLGWEPPRPSLDANRRSILNNSSGEDFLYMHRRMIQRVNTQLAEIGDPSYPRVSGWVQVPTADDADFPVPPPWFIPGAEAIVQSLIRVKSQEFLEKRIRFWERQFTDVNFLRSISLGELGARLEFTIHNQLHNRFSAQPYGDRPELTDPSQSSGIPTIWDDPRYDYLGDTYSSHVNSVFWFVHGWVDDRIDDWRYANGTAPVVFQGTWEGVVPPSPPMGVAATAGHDGHGGHNHDLENMEAAVRVLGKCPGRYSFWMVD